MEQPHTAHKMELVHPTKLIANIGTSQLVITGIVIVGEVILS